jgi:Xaa-Pro aminopeptidase
MRDQSHLEHADKQAEPSARRDRLARLIGDQGIAVFAATPERRRNNDVDYPYRPDSDFRYLTGFPEPRAIGVLAPGAQGGDYTLFCRERDAAQEAWIGRRAGTEGALRDYGADNAYPLAEFETQLTELLAARERLFIHLDGDSALTRRVLRIRARMDADRRRGAAPPETLVSLDRIVHEMRLRKSAAEIALMRQAAAVSARGHVAAMHPAAPGAWEYQLAAAIHYEFECDGMTWAYPSIVGAGANACVLHYIENSARLKDGDLVLIDAGAEYRGYAGDITRTFPANGRFSRPQRALYDIVLAANTAAIAACRPGAPANAPHQAARAVLVDGLIELGLLAGSREEAIESESYRDYFMHGTSHWLGMDVHDVGAYKIDGDWRALEPGMALTIEPGLYVRPDDEAAPMAYRGIGIRVEDDVVITDEGYEVLTGDVPKAPEAIEALMAGGAVNNAILQKQ